MEQLALKIYGSSFSASLNFSNEKLISFSIEYNEKEKFTISGADIVISIGNYHYVAERKDLLSDFNKTVIEKYKEKIKGWEVNENEAKQLLLDLLDYISRVTKEGTDLIEKVKSAVKSENVKVKFSSESEFSSYSKDKEVEGLDKLRTGALMFALASIFFTLAFFMLLASVLFPTVTEVGTDIDLRIVGAIGTLAEIIAWLNVRRGFEILNNLGKDVGIGYAGSRLIFLSILFSIQGLGLIIGGEVLLIIGNVVGVVGNVLIGIGYYEVGDAYNNSITKIGGIIDTFPIYWLSSCVYRCRKSN